MKIELRWDGVWWHVLLVRPGWCCDQIMDTNEEILEHIRWNMQQLKEASDEPQ